MDCNNLQRLPNGSYEDPITLEEIPANRIITFTRGNNRLCYDALSLVRSLENDDRQGRQIRLPDNNLLLTPAGQREAIRISRLSFPQTYQVSGVPQNFTTRELAEAYVSRRPGRQYQISSFAVIDDPEIEDLLFPDGSEPSSNDRELGDFFDEEAMEARNQAYQPLPPLPPAPRLDPFPLGGDDNVAFLNPPPLEGDYILPGEIEIRLPIPPGNLFVDSGDFVARQARPGQWRCAYKESLRHANPDNRNAMFNYCYSDQLRELGLPADPRISNEVFTYQGEYLSRDPSNGFPGCSNDGGEDLGDMCRSDMVARYFSQPRPILSLSDDGYEEEVVYEPESDTYQCRNLDLDGEPYDCTDKVYDRITWREERPISYRRTSLRGQIDCATREEIAESLRERRDIPWHECSEAEKEILRQPLERDRDRGYNHFLELESGQLADEQEE